MFKDIKTHNKTWKNRVGRNLIENDIEKYGAKLAKRLGWDYEKFSSPEKSAVPDRLVTVYDETLDASIMFFIELKRPGKQSTEMQYKDHTRRRAKGFMVFVADSYEQIDLIQYVVYRMLHNGYTFVPTDEIPVELIR